MIEHFKILTVTHKRVNLKRIREFVVHGDDVCARLAEIKTQFQLDELLYLATCNRVMYLFVNERPLDEDFQHRFFQAVNPQLQLKDSDNLSEIALALEGEEAINHLFEVAASMDSLVIGERQILRQLREAYDSCHALGLCGDNIRLAFQQAVHAAKEVYAKTRIGDKPVSVVSLSIQKLLKHNLAKDARILLVGAGQTNALAAKFLVKHHFENVTVFNRSIERARQLAKFVKGRALPLSQLPEYQEGFDCIIVCTGSNEPVITLDNFPGLLRGEQTRKILIDLSVPHNVAREVTEQFAVDYIEIEDLRHLAKENLAFREQEVQKARTFLEDYVADFPALLRQRQIELAMRSVPTEIKAVKSKAINEVFRKDLESLSDNERALVERMLDYMEKKCIGIPMRAAREATVRI